MREKTNVYFLAEINRGNGMGDCILLENIDSNGIITHALIDTGIKIRSGVACDFLKKHNVEKISFLCLTHCHSDHNENTVSVLNKYKVDLIIMKEFDKKYSPNGNQTIYENIIEKAIEKNIKILGVSFESLGSEEYSPTQSNNFKNNIIKNAKKENFEYFNEKNVILEFGSADIKIMNWEIFDTEGNLFVTGKNIINGKKVYRAIYSGDNENSLGILLLQGDKKAFFAGDMNNTKKNVGGEQIGDEDRLKYEIGKIDLLKLGHHGYSGSNTIDYLNVLMPNYAIITNDIGYEYEKTKDFLEKNKVNYLYTTHDEYEVCAIIYNNEITLGFGTEGVKKVKDEIFYIPKSKIYANYLTNKIPVKFKSIEKSVNNWEELKKEIEENSIIKGELDKDGKTFIAESLKINLNTENNNNIYNANSTILLKSLRRIQIVSKEKEIIIKRDSSLIDSPLFKIEIGIFLLGEENMKGKIIIDGNKVESKSHLIQLKFTSELSIYDNITLCNNINKITTTTAEYGSAILADKSKINIYGGERSNNIFEVNVNKTNSNEAILPEIMKKDYIYDAKGAGIFMNYAELYMYGGKICKNEGIINTDIYSNQNSTNFNSQLYGIYHRCSGIAIYGKYDSKLYLYKGEISNNYAKNNAKINLISPKENTITNIKAIINYIYGSTLYLEYSEFQMFKDFVIQDNYSLLNPILNIEKNCKVTSCKNAIKGGQIYIYSSQVKIHGGIIQNSHNKSTQTINIFSEEEDENKFNGNGDAGGGLNFASSKDIEITNLKIENCNSRYGGAICLYNSTMKISNSELNNNLAESSGGGIYIEDKNCELELYNTKITNNSSKDENGGGIFDNGNLIIDGENTLISNNEAGKNGGGIMVKNHCQIKNGIISNNKALKYFGGGIYSEGHLFLEKAKIFNNSCEQRGGGIYYTSTPKFLYDKNKIDSIVYDNTATINGNNFYPEIN